jgi:hypothetical protein
MAKKLGPRCKACWEGDCPDCTRWTVRDSVCQHPCDTIPRQLGLFPAGGAGLSAPPASTTRPAAEVPAPRRRT